MTTISDKEWHYLEVCRGRLLCPEHGGYCDSSDAHADKCPLCLEEGSLSSVINPIDRGLQIMKNLQNRSARNAAIVSGVIGALSVLFVFGGTELTSIGLAIAILPIRIAVVCGFLCIGLFLSSMAHMPITESDVSSHTKKTIFMTKSLDDWETYVVTYLEKFEARHKFGIWAFGGAIFCVALSIMWPAFGITSHDIWNW